MVPIFKGKDDIRNSSCNRAVKLLEHGMKMVEMVLEKRPRRIVTVDDMQFGFMPERRTTDAVFISRRLQKEYHGKMLFMCFVDLEKDFDRGLREVMEWATRKKVIPVFVRSVMSLYDGAKKRVRLDSELSEQFAVEVGMHQGSVLSPLIFVVLVDVTEFASERVLSE